jgi:hypothetical protein
LRRGSSLIGRETEQRHLAHRLLLLLERRLLHCGVERRPVLRAVAAESVERARRDQRLEHALVAGAQIDPLGEVEEAREGSRPLCGENRIDRAASDVRIAPSPKRIRFASSTVNL